MALDGSNKNNKKHKARATRKQKELNNYSRQRDQMDYYDFYRGDYRDYNKVDKFKVNYGLFEGMLDVKLYDNPLCFDIADEEVTFDHQQVSHYPLISQVAKAIVGEQANRPFKPMVKDNTPERQTYFKKEANQRIQQYLQQGLSQKRQEAMQKVLQGAGISDPYSLSPEEQMQIAQQIDQIVSKETPESITDYLRYEFQTPLAKQAQNMLDYFVESLEVKSKETEGFKHAVTVAEEYYYVGERNGEIVFEVVPPMFFDWGGSSEVEWSQHGTWAKRERWLTYEDALQRHAKYLSEKDLKDLEYYHEQIGGDREWRSYDTPFHEKVMRDYANKPELQSKYGDINIKTRSGGRKMLDMYSDIMGSDPIFGDRFGGNNGASSYGIREAHIVWRDKRILKQVKRLIQGEEKTFYLDEHYVEQPEDYEVKKIWVDEIWEGWKLGSHIEAKYINVRPVPYQYKSLENPFSVDMPYYGRRYNTNNNITKNSSLVDLGKTFNKDFDMTMSSLKHDMATNFGNKIIMMLNLKPEGWKWQEWMDVIKNSPMIPIEAGKKGFTNIDSTLLKQVDLSKMSDISSKIGLLSFQRDGVAKSMYFNEARIGAVGQYATSTNTEANQVASYNQTALFFEQHRMVVEKALQGLLNYGRFFYKSNPDKAIFLDDVSIAELVTGPYTSYEKMGISLNNSPQELQKIQMLKQNALSLIQNGTSPESVTKLLLADTSIEVLEIMKKESIKIEEQRAQAQQVQQEQFQAQLQSQQQKEKESTALMYKMHQETLASQEQRSLIDSQKFMLANDVDGNKQSDLLEAKLMELQAKMQMHQGDMDIEREKLELKEKLELFKNKQ